MRLEELCNNKKMYPLCWVHCNLCTVVFTAHSEGEVESKSRAGALFSTGIADASAHDQRKMSVS